MGDLAQVDDRRANLVFRLGETGVYRWIIG